MRHHQMKHFLVRILVLVYEEFLGCSHAISQGLIILRVKWVNVIEILIIVDEVDPIKELVYEIFPLFRCIEMAGSQSWNRISSTKFQFCIEMLTEHVVQAEFFDAESFANLGTCHHSPQERRRLNYDLVKWFATV